MAELLLGQPQFPGESGVNQLVEIIKVLQQIFRVSFSQWGGKGPTVVLVGASYGPLTSGIYELIQVPWTNERPLENRELNAIIGAWFTLWRD
ncbi:hypothetical protein Tco_1420730 [Tanacetum coccineum]